MKLIGRLPEVKKFDKLVASSKSEFVAVYGRRRVGKTFLIRAYFQNQFDLYATGLAKGNTQQQLTNTKKSVFLTLLTTHGLKENEYSRSAIQNELTMNDLFDY
jgi:AAA+ ATPase superfamily predicted ATPase